MAARILVAYATKYGSTAGIAGAIAKELAGAGLDATAVDLMSVGSLEGYDGVVLGAPVYMGRPLDLAPFVARHADALSRVPVAAFAVGLAPVSPKAGQLEQVRTALSGAVAPLVPVATAIFPGALDPSRMGLADRAVVRLIGAPTGDHRDWEAVAAWARELVSRLSA
ncbi:MAG TPA: flavodoxin domain-containing protein [Methanoregulaceae archaeon]|nr:flavodoxin domain-containing protein [Methanoregulaceae archaeon]HQJ88073.1 flavodoxin domain-containing protein [Methanoregulaceae archaeon]